MARPHRRRRCLIPLNPPAPRPPPAPGIPASDFYERPGALHDFLARRIQGKASLCYFNYQQSGERIGRALIGLDFPSPKERDSLLKQIPNHGEGYRLCEVLDEATRKRLTGSYDHQ